MRPKNLQRHQRSRTILAACLAFLWALAGEARGATDAGALSGAARLTPYWNDNWPYDRITFFPLILKGDLKGGYPHQRGEETGQAGTPLYTFTEEGELDEAFMITLTNNGSGGHLWRDRLWEGSLRKFKYERSAVTQLAPEAESGVLKWDLARKLRSTASGGEPQSRALFYWFGLGANLSQLDASLQGDGTIFEENGAPYPEVSGYYSQRLGLGAENLTAEAATYPWHPSRMLLGWTIGRDYRAAVDGKTVSLHGARTMLPDMGQGSMALLPREPQIPGASPKRGERLLFVQSNEGILHAVDAENAGELMAFVPPNVAEGSRLAFQKLGDARRMTDGFGTAQKNFLAFGKWLDSSGSGAANPAFVADGAVVVRDVVRHTGDSGGFGYYSLKSSYAASEWETLIFGGSGRGGAGIYSLRMANGEGSLTPERFSFNWAVENNLYSFIVNQGYPIKGETVYWSPAAGSTGAGRSIMYRYIDGSPPAEYAGEDKGPLSYWRLGWNAPEPVLGTMLLPNGRATNLLVVAGGYQYFADTSTTGDVGATIYLIDPFSGRILQRRDPTAGFYHRQDIVNASTPGTFQGIAATSMGMMLTPPTPVTFDGTKVNDSYQGDFLRSVFTADHRGNIFELSFVVEDHSGASLKLSPRGTTNLIHGSTSESENPRWIATLIDTGAPNVKGESKNVIPYRFAVSQADDGFGKDLWITGGTADAPTIDMTRSQNGTVKTTILLENASQYIFGFKRRDPGASTQYFGEPVISISRHGAPLDREVNRDTMPEEHQSDPMRMPAWHIELEKDERGKPVEYVSAAPFAYGDNALYVATYLPQEGNSRLYYLDPRSGKGLWNRSWGPKYYTVYGAQVRGFDQAKLPAGTDTAGGSTKLETKILVSYTGVLQETVTQGGEVVADIKEDLGATILTANTGDAEVFSMIPGYEGGADGESGERIYYWRRYRVD